MQNWSFESGKQIALLLTRCFSSFASRYVKVFLVRKHCSGVKSDLRTVCGFIRYRTCVRGNHDNKIDIDFGMDLGNRKYQERDEKFCFLGEKIKGKRRLNYSISRKDTMCMGKIYKFEWSHDKKGCAIEVRRRNVCSVRERCHAVWERELRCNYKADVELFHTLSLVCVQ